MKILFVGYGDIAQRTAALLDSHQLYGIARRPKPKIPNLDLWQGDILAPAMLEKLSAQHWDAVVVTLSPDGRDEISYRSCYVDITRAVLNAFSKNSRPGYVIWVSSTSVYAQHSGERVDESSETCPAHFRGKIILEAENIVRASPIAYSIVRFSGIYGPGRDYLIRQVLAGKGGGNSYSNRIHQDDCAGFLAHLLNLKAGGQTPEPLYLASDGEAVLSCDLRSWLAEQLGVQVQQDNSVQDRAMGGNKICSNKRMLDSGYTLRYPSFRLGYSEMLPQNDGV